MARKGQIQKREILPDPKYKDKLVSKLINKIMLQGKKPAAEKIVYEAFNLVSEKTKDDPLKVFKESLENIKPLLEVRSRRVGGATYQVPMEVRPDRKVSLGLRWLVLHARERGEKSMEEKLANEILDALQKRGGSIKKREDVHRMAEANRAFAHYRW
ncbi:MAG: 30S ribosomal protein S7 [Deltaproteobacteria bacterium]|nr:MAG: 30S ribosomal protein S7 [Deltaproteobacteria bacterium]